VGITALQRARAPQVHRTAGWSRQGTLSSWVPGGSTSWYDWVLVDDTVSGSKVPAKIWAIIVTADESVELIATVARQRTGADSVLFTEWKYLPTYKAITTAQLVEPVFIVKVDLLLTISTMCSQHRWNTHFTSMSDTLTKKGSQL
jgi:hypothetical protein